MARKDISAAGRVAFLDEYKNWVIEVATGYDVVSDLWLVHAYVTAPGGVREKLAVHEPVRRSMDDALIHGYETAVAYVDHFAG
ncbi:hypothetical protein [Burkholderia cenocepacia]|uniref:hypothetical protein n=1 Tax=Burkholderia cenocepacia TaxID=95486 RepID=UPI0028765D72|nr:hypothetical protein [Burkholderia cenocepacia]MDS0850425.1 hypothetical protein [Burkholderia cenocepacia]